MTQPNPTAQASQPEGRTDFRVAGSLSLAALLLYLATLCRTIYLGDGGEIVTAIHSGGVMHPPGYPLFSLLGRLFLVIVPIGEPAFRVGVLVAACAAAAVGVLYLICRVLEAGRAPSVAAAGVFGASYSFWSQSTRVEVYSLHILLASLAILFALRYRRDGLPVHFLAAVGAAALGLAHHLTIVVLGPCLLALCLPRLWSQGRKAWALVAGAAGMVGATASSYGLLMLWARADPIQNFGRPVDLPLLISHASARLYRVYLRPPSPAELGRGLLKAGQLLADAFPFFLWVAAAAGVVILWRRNRGLAASLLLGVVSVAAYNQFYLIEDIAPYYLTAWVIVAALLALGLDALLCAARLPEGKQALAYVVTGAILTAPLSRNWAACDLSRVTWVRDFARQKLAPVSQGGVLVTYSDTDTFPIWYLQDVLRERQDVIVIDRLICNGTYLNWGLDTSAWYLHRLRLKGVPVSLSVPADIRARQRLGDDGRLLSLLNGPLKGRPLFSTFIGTERDRRYDRRVFMTWAAQKRQALPVGLVLQLADRGAQVDLPELLRVNERLWGEIDLPDFSSLRTDQDLDPTYVQQHYATMLTNFGGLHEMAGNRARAEKIYRTVTTWAPAYAPAQAALNQLTAAGKQAHRPDGSQSDATQALPMQ